MSVVEGVTVVIPPPEGYAVDFENPQRNSVVASSVISGFGMSLAFLFLAQRLYVKAFICNRLGIDDVLLIIAWLGSVAIQVLTICSFVNGWMGVHVWEIPFDKIQEANFWATYINSIVYTIPTCFSKIVILLFLLELNSNQAWYRWSVYVGMFAVAGSSFGIFLSSVFPCTPFRKSWDLTISPDVGSCIDRRAMFRATAGLGVATDILLIAIPVPTIIRLHLSAKKKAALIDMFAIGSLTVITSMIRLGLAILQLDKIDTTWVGGPIHVWICIEANLLIICACLSTLRRFLMIVDPHLLSSTRGTSPGKFKTGISSGHKLQTIGGTGRSVNRSQYTQFDEPFCTTTRAEVGIGWRNRSERAESIDSKLSNGDERSDKGTMQMTTAQVYYSDARGV